MNWMSATLFRWWLFTILLTGMVCSAGCGASTNLESNASPGVGTGGTGVAKIDVTDAASVRLAHVYVTVTGVAFHADAKAAFSASGTGWQTFQFNTPQTVDLAALSNGTTYADQHNGASLFNDVQLPVGTYRQLRLFLASSEEAYRGTITGLTYNNEVIVTGDPTEYPLRVPSPDGGIRITPDAAITVTSHGEVSVTVDFNLADDVVLVYPNGTSEPPEYVLKPRLGYFNMKRVGAVKGNIGFTNISTSSVEVKAEQVDTVLGTRVVRRATTVNKSDPQFKLYPLPIFGDATTARYDLVVRGRNVQTALIKGVIVHRGTKTVNAVDLGTITLQQGGQFSVKLAAEVHPTGAWLTFYQTIAGDPIPYELRYRHLDPYTGTFGSALGLSAEPIQVASYSPGVMPLFSPDSTSQGTFTMVMNAGSLYAQGAPVPILRGKAGQSIPLIVPQESWPQPVSGTSPGSITCQFNRGQMGSGSSNITKGQLFITNGGMIIDSLVTANVTGSIGKAMAAGGGANNPITISNLPSGVEGAMYSIFALGWGKGVLMGGTMRDVDLTRGGNVTAVIPMY